MQKDDVIYRQTAIELIKNYCENGCDIAEDNWCPSCQREQFIKLLKALPSAQSEIVHCKYCAHSVHSGRGDIYLCTVSPEEVREHKYDFYCGYAERRTD